MIWPEQDKHTPQMVANAWKWMFTGLKEPPEYVCRAAGGFGRFECLAMPHGESFRLQPDGGQSRCAYLEKPSVRFEDSDVIEHLFFHCKKKGETKDRQKRTYMLQYV